MNDRQTDTHTFSKTPLGERSASSRDLYRTTHKLTNYHNGQTSIPPGKLESAISAGERPQTHALDTAASVIAICIEE